MKISHKIYFDTAKESTKTTHINYYYMLMHVFMYYPGILYGFFLTAMK